MRDDSDLRKAKSANGMVSRNNCQTLDAPELALCTSKAVTTPVTIERVDQSSIRLATGPRSVQGKQRTKYNALKHGILSKAVVLRGESRAEYQRLVEGLRENLRPVGIPEEVLVEKLAILLWRQRRLIAAERADIENSIRSIEPEQQNRDEQDAEKIELLSSLDQGGLINNIDNPYVLNHCLRLLIRLRELFSEKGFRPEDLEILGKIYGNADQQGKDLCSEYRACLHAAGVSLPERHSKGYPSPDGCRQIVLKRIDKELRRLKRCQKKQLEIKAERKKLETVRRGVPDGPALDRQLRYGASLERDFDRTLSQLERLQRMRLGQPATPRIEVNVSA
jgi:hypothetical protein